MQLLHAKHILFCMFSHLFFLKVTHCSIGKVNLIFLSHIIVISLKIYFLFMCVWACLRVCVCVPTEDGEGAKLPWGWSYRWLWTTHTRVLRTEVRSSSKHSNAELSLQRLELHLGHVCLSSKKHPSLTKPNKLSLIWRTHYRIISDFHTHFNYTK